MHDKKENTFFTKDIYETEIALHVNAEVLERIYSSNLTSEIRLPIEFFYVSDQEVNLKRLGLYLITNFPKYNDLKVQNYKKI